MAAKIRAKEILTSAVETEYLKLYALVFVGWFLSSVGSHMLLNGFPLGNGVLRGVLGLIFGILFWGPGAIALLVGLVATTRKVILETTRDELVEFDRVVESPTTGSPATSDETTDGSNPSAGSNLKAGSGPDARTVGNSSSRVDRPDDESKSQQAGQTQQAENRDADAGNGSGSRDEG